MTMRRVLYLLAAGVSATATAAAQGTQAAPRLERTVVPGARGPNRLAIDSAFLVGASPLAPAGSSGGGSARAGFGDLRLHDDARPAEVPYLIVWPTRSAETWLGERPTAVTPRPDTSGFELDFRAPRTIDGFGVGALPEGTLKRVRLEGSSDRVHWVVLVDEGTLFNLPMEGRGDRGLRQTELAFPTATVRYVRLTADDHLGAPLPLPRIAMVRMARTDEPAADSMRSALTFERRPSAPRTSRFHVTLPAPRLPIAALELDAGGAQLMRLARVTESRLVNGRVEPARLGESLLRRTTRGGAVAANLQVPIGPAAGAEVDLEVDDGDNPPLDLRAVRAVYGPLPFIYFESESGAELRATFGTNRTAPVAPPRYDLEALRDTVQRIAAATASWGAMHASVASATPAADVPGGPGAPDTTRAPHAESGAPLVRHEFSFARALPVGAGLTAVRLDPAALAHSRIDDVRILDPQGRQVPYMLERLAEPTLVPLGAPEPTQPRRDVDARVLAGGDAKTWYRVRLPMAGLPDVTLRLETTARVFVREVAVVTRELPRDAAPVHAGDRAVAAQWAHDEPESAAPPIEIALGDQRLSGDSLYVVVDDGDNQALPLTRTTLVLPTYRLRFFRQAGVPLVLAYGRADLGSPHYDLELLAPRLLDAPAQEVVAQAEPVAPVPTRMPQYVFWAALGVVVTVLLILVARLVRSSPPPVPGDATG